MPHGNPPQMFDHGIDPIKGWFSLYSLDKSAAAADPADTRLIAGRVVHLDSAGLFVPGLAADAVGIFLWQSGTSFDVTRDSGGIGGLAQSGLVSTGAYELESTEFQAGTFAPNTPITADAPGAGADIGKVKEGTIATDTIVGIASDGKRTNENGVEVIRFWTYFLPASV